MDLVLARPGFPGKCPGERVEVRYDGGGGQTWGGLTAQEKVCLLVQEECAGENGVVGCCRCQHD